MPKIVLYIARSLDGYIAQKDGGISWLDQFNSVDYGYNEFIASIDIVVMGSKTYEQVLTFGAYPYTGKKTIVYTKRHLKKPDTEEITYFHTFSKTFYESMPEHTNVWLVGGAQIIQAFTKENLITEYQIFTMPFLLGFGIPLFLETHPQQLVHQSTKTYTNGVILTKYTHI